MRIKDPRDARAWSEFHDLYAPLLYHYARARGLDHDDAEDVRSKCYESIVRHMPEFEYDKRKGGFKAWLRTLVTNRVIDHFRKRREQIAESGDLRNLPANDPSPDEIFEDHWRLHHLRFCLERVRHRVSGKTLEVFHLLTNERQSVADVCGQLDMNTNQVYKAKARVLNMIREEMVLLGTLDTGDQIAP